MKYWVGVTDNSWFKNLSTMGVDEVNFWQPRGRVSFTSLRPGSLFLFKLKKPHNHIVGGGYFVRSTSLPLSIAWETFEKKNGAKSRLDFESMIRKFTNDSSIRDPEIGCIVLAAPFFWPENLWIPDPIGFAGNIVRGRYYDTEKSADVELWNAVQLRLEMGNRNSTVQLLADHEPIRRFGAPITVKPRLGQGAFRVLVTDAYKRRCAITGEHTLPVLEAAHILPFSKNGPHEVTNGLLLRSDFHKLFDLGMITITKNYKIEVSPRIKEEYFNGKAYYRLHGENLQSLPDLPEERPDKNLLIWHNENIFH